MATKREEEEKMVAVKEKEKKTWGTEGVARFWLVTRSRSELGRNEVAGLGPTNLPRG